MKKVIIPISILIFICLSLGIFGFILNINADEKEKAVKVSYRYFIMVKNLKTCLKKMMDINLININVLIM